MRIERFPGQGALKCAECGGEKRRHPKVLYAIICEDGELHLCRRCIMELTYQLRTRYRVRLRRKDAR